MIKRSLPVVLTLVLFLTGSKVNAQADMTAEQVYDLVNQSVVMIISTEFNGSEDQGSGVVIMDGGYIATCSHLIQNSKTITVIHQNLQFTDAEIVSQDYQKDLAIIKLSRHKLTPVKLADSDNLKPGQKVFTISSPVGYENTISEGIISGIRRDNLAANLIQTTAPITEGSSGGALLNKKGELIGILSSGHHDGNLYFSIPSKEIAQLYNNNSQSIAKNEQVGEQNYNNFFNAGIQATEKGDYEEAIKLFSKHLQMNSNDAAAYFNRGNAYGKINNKKQEISDYTIAIRLNPNFAEAYNSRGLAYRQLLDYENAVSDYTKAIKINSDYTEAIFNRAIAYYYMEKFELSAADYSAVLNIRPAFANAYYNRGYAYKQAGRFNEAMEDFEMAIKLNSDYDQKLKPTIDEIQTAVK